MQRKTVTVLFCDVTGSTELGESVDPEALRELLARYFERMKTIVERHGGTVEKFIGDAVMAVFGVPAAHEDDALRAVRAAEEMRDALPELGVQARIGLTTGIVLTGTEERLATGTPSTSPRGSSRPQSRARCCSESRRSRSFAMRSRSSRSNRSS
jgi:class 3 adenylate cyclase